jgi:hypothetical protein
MQGYTTLPVNKVRKLFDGSYFELPTENVQNGKKLEVKLEREAVNMERILEAVELVCTMHEGQWYGDAPYFTHLFGVASMMKTESGIIVALVHDLFEDTDCSIMQSSFLSAEEFEAARLLTKTAGLDFTKYMENIKRNPLACAVKLGDSTYNLESCMMDGGKKKNILEYTEIIRFLKSDETHFTFIKPPKQKKLAEEWSKDKVEIERNTIDVKRVVCAVKLACDKHIDQWYGDSPYITHLFGVAGRLTTESEIIVGILHDAFERAGCLVREVSFLNPEEFNALRLLTKAEGVTYEKNIEDIGNNLLATRVKISELKYNLKMCRINSLKSDNVMKYTRALNYLQGILNQSL